MQNLIKNKKNKKSVKNKKRSRADNSVSRKAKKNKKLRYIDSRPDLKIPTVLPNKFKPGSVRKGRDNKLWKVVRQGNVKKWVRASRMDVRCNNYLMNSIKANIKKFNNRNSKYRSRNQAIAIAYAMTKKKFPNCSLVR
jgi:hypothetical protein